MHTVRRSGGRSGGRAGSTDLSWLPVGKSGRPAEASRRSAAGTEAEAQRPSGRKRAQALDASCLSPCSGACGGKNAEAPAVGPGLSQTINMGRTVRGKEIQLESRKMVWWWGRR